MNSMIFPGMLFLAYGLATLYFMKKSIKATEEKAALALLVIGKATGYIAVIVAIILICAALFY